VGARLAADWGLVARDWLHHAGLAPCRVQDAPTALRNLNTPEDWRRYRNGHA
jgi:molybdopterin-guanine dinucleotide biosynthesis protein A